MHHSNTWKLCAQKQTLVVILYTVNVVFCKGWVGLAHRILLKDVFVRFSKSYVRRCLGNEQGKLCSWARWSSKVCSSPNHSDAINVCKLVSSLSSSQWAVHVSREQESCFNSRSSDALWRKLSSAGIIFVCLGCWILFIYSLINLFTYLFFKLETKTGLKAVCVGCV